MSDEEFNALVERLDARSRQHPALFRLQVMALAIAGYVYLLLLAIGGVICSIALLALVVFKPILLVKLLKVVWLPIWFTWSVLRSLWVRLSPPQGRVVTAAEAPILFAEIEKIRGAMDGPRPHRVLITSDYNAAVTQVPLLGPFGWMRSYLIVGLPFMSAMSPDQFRAVLAHEFGHLCAGDSRIGGRIYQARVTWGRLQEQFQARAGFFLRGFLRWFAPRFNAYSLVLARAQEYAADAASVKVVGMERAAEALVLSGVGAQFQNQAIWEPLWGRTLVEEAPTQMPFQSLLGGRSGISSWQQADVTLERAMRQQTDWSDTHPSLSDRLKAIGAQPPVLSRAVAGTSAADAFLVDLGPRLAKEMDDRWSEAIASRWRERFHQTQALKAELAALDASAAERALAPDELVRRAHLTDRVVGTQAAMPLYQAAHEALPQAPEPAFALGRMKLEQGDEAGLALLDLAMAGDDEAIKPAAELAWAFLKERGREEEAKRWQDAWLRRNQIEQLAQAERAVFAATDTFDATALDPARRAEIAAGLGKLGVVAGAWWVDKRVSHFPDQRPQLLVVETKWYRWTNEAKVSSKVREAARVPDDVTVVVWNSDLKQLCKAVAKTRASAVYPA